MLATYVIHSEMRCNGRPEQHPPQVGEAVVMGDVLVAEVVRQGLVVLMPLGQHLGCSINPTGAGLGDTTASFSCLLEG